MRVALALVVVLAAVMVSGSALARGHRRATPDPFGELFVPAKKASPARRHHHRKVAQRLRHARVRLVATLGPTPAPQMLVASSEPFFPAAWAPNRHALAGP